MKYLMILLVGLSLILGCSSQEAPQTNASIENVSVNTVNVNNVIFDNDHFDPDWVIGLDTILELHNNNIINVATIVLTGTDIYGKAGRKYDSIVRWHDLDIPIGINHRTPMRVTPDDASASYPKLASRYQGVYGDITEFTSDGLQDINRVESVALLCETLTSVTDKSVTYIIGGHLQNLSDLQKEKEYCDGNALIHSKINKIVINTGGIGGDPEMNLSEGKTTNTETANASINVFTNISVPIYVTAEFMGTSKRPGDVYLTHKINSPQEFIIAVPRYGTYGDHGISDNAAIMVGIYGTNINGNEFVVKQKTCFIPNNINGSLTLGGCNKEHYFMVNMNVDLVADYTIELLKQ